MKYNVGDKVRIKSIDWYNENKDEYGYINCGSRAFFTKMSNWCGKILTIRLVVEEFEYYCVSECIFSFTDEMIEGFVEEENLIERVDDNGLPFNEWLSHKGAFHVPEDYVLKDENGNVINATKIVLEKKKKEYPKTYEECCEIIHSDPKFYVDTHLYSGTLETLYKLLICRDAYWKIAGEEMGLEKPWEPDWKNHNIKYILYNQEGEIDSINVSGPRNYILSFPTEEMRDTFFDNFKEEIEKCKELL